MGGLSVPSKLMAALFQSVSTRTAGKNTIALAACSPISKLLMSVLQFIGAAPGSTGGGVKVTPLCFLIVKDGNVRMRNVMPPASNTFDRLIDMTPQVIDCIAQFIAQRKADKA